jgi:hypothetical protein
MWTKHREFSPAPRTDEAAPPGAPEVLTPWDVAVLEIHLYLRGLRTKVDPGTTVGDHLAGLDRSALELEYARVLELMTNLVRSRL